MKPTVQAAMTCFSRVRASGSCSTPQQAVFLNINSSSHRVRVSIPHGFSFIQDGFSGLKVSDTLNAKGVIASRADRNLAPISRCGKPKSRIISAMRTSIVRTRRRRETQARIMTTSRHNAITTKPDVIVLDFFLQSRNCFSGRK